MKMLIVKTSQIDLRKNLVQIRNSVSTIDIQFIFKILWQLYFYINLTIYID